MIDLIKKDSINATLVEIHFQRYERSFLPKKQRKINKKSGLTLILANFFKSDPALSRIGIPDKRPAKTPFQGC
jgi:hypothetical protein